MNIFEIEAAAETGEQIAVLCGSRHYTGRIVSVGSPDIHKGLRATVEYPDGLVEHYKLSDIYRIEN
jgi:hypothetical protein